MNEQEKEEYGTKIANLLTDHLLIKSITTLGSNITISGEIFGNTTLEDISRALTSHGVRGSITLQGSDAEIRIKLQSDKITGIPIINILLFVATIITTTLAGAMMEGVTDPFSLEGIISGLPFSITLLSILLFHEFGHYFASKRNNVTATLPYFIPAPTFIGTFGAFIKMKSPIIDRKSLLEIGAAGPIAGFLVAVPALYYGLSTSEVLESVGGAGIHLGDSIIMMILTSLIHPNIADGYDIYLSSIAFAGWIGLLVTSLNLIPIGQLDGGHIAYALFGKKHDSIAKWAFLPMIPLGYYSINWILWAILILVFIKLKHPPVVDEDAPLKPFQKWLGYISIAIFILTFIPIPFS